MHFFDSYLDRPYHCAPMSTTRMPTRVEPYRLAASAERLEGDLPLDEMPRLADVIGPQTGVCHVVLTFGIDAQRRHYIEGQAEARVMMPCLRCLHPMPVTLDSSILLGMVTDESLSSRLPREYDPLVVGHDERLDLIPVIEEELLLALPQAIYHEEGECAVSRDELSSGELPDEQVTTNPFSALAALKDKH